MDRTLWTVLADHQPVAVVAAESAERAWHIVGLLDEHRDLPPARRDTRLVPCPPADHARTVSLARQLGCAASFLACVRGGMFLTHIDGMVAG